MAPKKEQDLTNRINSIKIPKMEARTEPHEQAMYRAGARRARGPQEIYPPVPGAVPTKERFREQIGGASAGGRNPPKHDRSIPAMVLPEEEEGFRKNRPSKD
jgi:hypothetical protein